MKMLDFPPADWQTSLKNVVTDPAELLEILELPQSLLEQATKAAQLFPLRVPHEFIARMQRGKIDDPLLQQILPIAAEFSEQPGFTTDPLEESQASPSPGVVHKYRDRVLLILSGACAVNCRYCFRRHFPYGDNQLSGKNWQRALDYIRSKPEVQEVIFSGGDPLVTSDLRLTKMIADLEQIKSVQRLRIHTRLPVVIPSRITAELIHSMQNSRFDKVLVLHINHPQEINAQLQEAARRLRVAGITLLNQAVLLKGINDNDKIQSELSRALFKIGVLPYYLFLFDPVKGAGHFDIPMLRAQQIAAKMQESLPGYLMPRLAKEIPGQASKTLILPLGNQ